MSVTPSGHVRVAVLGAGFFSHYHCHSWQRIPEARLVAVCDRDQSKARQWSCDAFASLDAMLAASAPDLLDIVVPPAAHADAIRAALTHGIKWLICQKPFCTDIHTARAIVNEVETAGATLIVHENVRFQPWYRDIKSALDSGRIGTPLQATFRLRPGDGQGPDAYLDRQPYFRAMPRFLVHETALHWVDTFRFLLGEPVAVYADLRRLNPVIIGEDAGYILLDHASGVRTLIDGNRLLDHRADDHRHTLGEALFEGTDGTVNLHGDGSIQLRPFLGTSEQTLRPGEPCEQFGGDCVHHLQCHAISGLLHGTPLENVARDYLRVLDIEHAIYASAETGRKQSLSIL